MWRPNNWESLVYYLVSLEIYDREEVKLARQFIEVGADAILKAIEEYIDPEDAKAYGSQCCKCLKLFGIEEDD